MAKHTLTTIIISLVLGLTHFIHPMDQSTPEYRDLIQYLEEKGGMGWYKRDEKHALIRAANMGYTDMCKLLIAAKADVHHEDCTGNTALGVAEAIPICQLLLDAQADINHTDSIGMTKLMRVARRNNLALCKLLILAKADINYQSEFDGDSALMHAVLCDRVEICKLLIESNTDIYMQNNIQLTALMYVLSPGDFFNQADLPAKLEITKLILDATAQLTEIEKRSIFNWFLIYNRLQQECRGLNSKDLKRYIAQAIEQSLAQDLYDRAIRAGATQLLSRAREEKIPELIAQIEAHLNINGLRKIVCAQIRAWMAASHKNVIKPVK